MPKMPKPFAARLLKGRRSICLIALVAWCILLAASPPCAHAAGDGLLQGVIGAARFDADSLTFQVPSSEASQEKDLSSMPYVGFIGQHFFAGGSTQFGVEGGVLFGWRSRDTTVVAGSNQAVIKIDTSLWLLDLSAGVCLNQRLGSRWRLYLAAGPAMVFGEYEEDDDVRDQEGDPDPDSNATFRGKSDSEFGIGGYVRAGLEYEFAPQSLVGISVRGLATDMEFDNAVDSSSVRGVQGFLTFTRNFGGY